MNQVIHTEVSNRVAVVTLNRPEAKNAMNRALADALKSAIEKFGHDDTVGAIVLTGNEKVFSAGADIKEMTEKSFAEAYIEDFVSDWDFIPACRKPVIAAVNGIAFGGGCEIALQCDMIIADERATFAQPEVKIGTLPGGGGTQRWARAAGKGNAMDICLTGRPVTVEEAKSYGVVQRIAPEGMALDLALVLATKIASYSQPFVMMIKESVNRAFETSLREGLLFERRMLHAGFALDDQREAMSAFAEKRKPDFKHQ